MDENVDYTFINHNGEMIGAAMSVPDKDSKPYRSLSCPDAGAAEKLHVQPELGQAIGGPHRADRKVP